MQALQSKHVPIEDSTETLVSKDSAEKVLNLMVQFYKFLTNIFKCRLYKVMLFRVMTQQAPQLAKFLHFL